MLFLSQSGSYLMRYRTSLLAPPLVISCIGGLYASQMPFLESMREHDGCEPLWRGIYDDIGRLMAAICPNLDLGDSREHADNLSTPKGSPHLDSESASTTSFMQ